MSEQTTPRQVGRGVIHISQGVMAENASPLGCTLPSLLDETNTQRMLRDKGIFALLHKILILPENYTIVAVFQERLGEQWAIGVESDEILASRINPYGELPRITPVYTVTHWGEGNRSISLECINVDY